MVKTATWFIKKSIFRSRSDNNVQLLKQEKIISGPDKELPEDKSRCI